MNIERITDQYDQAIVEAALQFEAATQQYVAEPHIMDMWLDLAKAEDALHRAVRAKRDAQRPRCSLWPDTKVCGKPAVQVIDMPPREGPHYRCAEHRIVVQEL